MEDTYICIAILKKENATIPFEYLVEGQRANPDGCGLGWVENGELFIFKSMLFSEWVAQYQDVIARCGDIQMLIHFRITSKGETRKDMCHPFVIDEDHIVIHNGTISSIPKHWTPDGQSDTWAFAEYILANLPEGWEENEAILHLLEEYVGWSKLIVLDRWNNVTFLNEDKGHWLNNVWYSNKSYKKYISPHRSNYSDNYYGSTSGLIGYNRAANYTKNNSEATFLEYCDSCLKEFAYSDMEWVKGKCLCINCATFACLNNDEEQLLIEMESAGIFDKDINDILNAADMRKDQYALAPADCDSCNIEYMLSELYTVSVTACVFTDAQTMLVCRDCFKDLYTADEVTSIEVLY